MCVEEDCYSKYSQDVIRCFGDEINKKIIQFLNELDLLQRRLDGASERISESHKVAINYLGADIGLRGSTIDKITGWQKKRFNHTDCGIMLLFVIATNSSIGGLTGLWISKAEFVRTEISNLIYKFKNYKHNLQGDLILSIITYNKTANIHVWPTQLSNIDEHKIEIRALDENTARISAGLETALQMAQMHDGKTYVVLITDGKDDDRKKTKQAIDAIKHKRNIEHYTCMMDFFKFTTC